MAIDDLTTVLSQYPAVAHPLTEPEALGNAGGNSGVSLWRFETGHGLLLARAWPSDGMEFGPLAQIHEWQARAAALGFVPVPLRDRAGRTIQNQGGRLWDLSPWMPGVAETERPPRRARVLAGFMALASFHQTLSGQSRLGTSPGLNHRLEEIRSLQLGGFDVLQQSVANASEDPLRADALRWLELARNAAPPCSEALKQAAVVSCRLQPCLRDVRPDHLLFEGNRLTGLIDFGAMRFETVAADLARLLSEWVDDDRWARGEALEAYSSIRRLDDSEGALIETFESSAALLGGSHWIRWHFLDGRRFEDPDAVSQGLARGVERLLRSLAATIHRH